MPKPLRVAILGGGMGGLAAAWELSKDPEVEVTIYQRGWRLGGKGASGADVVSGDWRIEEHGLHILMGFYRNAFRILGECYDEVRAGGAWPHAELPALDDVLLPQKKIWVGEPRRNGWEFWENSLSLLDPWTLASPSPLQNGFDQLGNQIQELRAEIAALTNHQLPMQPDRETLVATMKQLPRMDQHSQLRVAEELQEIFDTAWDQAVQENFEAKGVGGYRVRQFLAILYLSTTIPIRLIQSGLLLPPYDFSKIDGIDFQVWLKGSRIKDRERGPLTWGSPYVRALYDLCFSLDKTLAAGVACNHLKEILFGWEKAVFFKMDGGMGDVVFAPLHLALSRRKNVTIRYFHRATAIELDASRRHVQRVRLERQVKGLATYDPLAKNPKDQLPAWPNEPLLDRMTDEYRARRAEMKRMPHDFETEVPSPLRDTDLVLERGAKDGFDVLVLAVSVGGLRGPLCKELRAHPPFARMLDDSSIMATRAFQLWLASPTETDLRWTEGRAMAGFAQPFSSCTDMNQTLRHEAWPAERPPKTLAYVCGSWPDAPADKETARLQVKRDMKQWMDDYGARLLPGADAEGGGFDWSELVHKDRGIYVRANVDPSDQYVLSESGSMASRLAPGDSGFANLFLAGDWVKNPLNSGCLESATLGGILASQAVLESSAVSKTAYVETDGDWSIRPPGVLADVTMNIFLVKADAAKLKGVCHALAAGPSGGKVEVEPLFPGFVMLVFADILRGYSTAQPELGYQAEKDVSIFVPVTLKVDGKREGLAAIAPYVMVDNVAGLVTGREVIGFPKHVAKLHFDTNACDFQVHSPVLAAPGEATPVGEALVARLTAVGPLAEELQPAVEGLLLDADRILAKMVEEAARELGEALPAVKFGEVPLVFLKQFRDAVDPRLACHQELVLAKTWISLPSKVRIRRGKFRLELPRYYKPSIGETLGIAAEPKVLGVSFELKLDFGLPAGISLWKAS